MFDIERQLHLALTQYWRDDWKIDTILLLSHTLSKCKVYFAYFPVLDSKTESYCPFPYIQNDWLKYEIKMGWLGNSIIISMFPF